MKITKAEYKNRISTLQRKLEEAHINTLIVSEEEDIYYLTGLTYKSLERLFLLVVKQNEVNFILPKMELAHLGKVDHVNHIHTYWEYPAISPDRWEDVLYEEVKDSHLIGISPKSPFEIGHFLGSQDLNIVNCNLIEQLRWVKSEAEIQLIKQAAKYCDITTAKLKGSAYYGMTELEVFSINSAIQNKILKETEFDYLASNILVAAWPSRIAHEPHGVPRVDDVLISGTHISLAFLRVNGYAAELERTFFTSSPTQEETEKFDIMLQARKASYDVLKAGVVAEEVDMAAREIFQQEGLGDYLMHRTGHGIGLGNHEGPYLAIGDKTVLQENMVVSIEPGIYIEGLGGFRHSDTVRITKDGYEILTDFDDQLGGLTFTRARPLHKLKGMIIRQMFGIK